MIPGQSYCFRTFFPRADVLQSPHCWSQIKATDNGRPQKSSTARLHIEWIRRPRAAPPLQFDQPFYNFTVMENDKVSEIVGVVSLQQSSTTVWFDITGERSGGGDQGLGRWALSLSCWLRLFCLVITPSMGRKKKTSPQIYPKYQFYGFYLTLEQVLTI